MTLESWVLRSGEDVQIVVFFGLMIALGIAERFIPRRSGSLARSRRWGANLALTFLNFLTLMAMPVSMIAAATWAADRGIGLFNQVDLSLGILIPATLLVRGFISFGTHLLMHKVPWLWRVHRVHHFDTELDVTTTVRFHPLEFPVSVVPGIAMIVTMGLSPWILVLYEIFDVIVTVFSHSNLHVHPGLERVLRRIIVTPDLHRIHHSAWQPETDSNFGAVFPVWDMIFGTYRTESRDGHEHMRLGLEDVRDGRARSLGWLLISCWR